MTAEFGVFFLVIALLTALLQSAYLWPDARLRALLFPRMAAACWLQALSIAIAFAILIALRLDSDFSVVNVALHSSLALPTLYKITGAWGNHEGSMLLWTLVLAAFGLAFCLRFPQEHHVKYIAVATQAALGAGVLLFILFTSNPFARQYPPALDGDAFNPILQDLALAFHPPLLYIGYVGFSLVFSLGVTALIGLKDPFLALPGKEKEYLKTWARMARPWALTAWAALTLGIGLGSWWAYRELGWGGFWFWDPVENASLLPWLSGAALIHSLIVLEKRGQLAAWVLLLSILTFALSLLGTFLVRSGALVSVHSFASDPGRGLFILLYMAVTIGGALFLYARSAPAASAEPMQPLSREGMIVFNNLFLLCACATVAIGTLYPLFAESISGDKLTVGAPYFNATFIPLMILPILFAGLAPLMPWKKAEIKETLRRAQPALLATGAAIVISLAWFEIQIAYAIIGIGLGSWLLASSLAWLKAGWKSLPRPALLCVFFGHAGAAILTLGITGAGIWQQEADWIAAPGDTTQIAGHAVRFDSESETGGEGYAARTARLALDGGDVLVPEYRVYDIRGTVTHEAAIRSTGLSDLYAVLGERDKQTGQTAIRLYWVPMVRLIWLGCLCMALGGALAVFNARRGYET